MLKNYLSSVSAAQLSTLSEYEKILLSFGSKVNLVSSNSLESGLDYLLIDGWYGSEVCTKNIPRGTRIVDFGSGNGTPGVMLSILNPESKVFYIERDLRKLEFLKTIIFRLGLKNSAAYSNLSILASENSKICFVSRALGTFAHCHSLVEEFGPLIHNYLHFKSKTVDSEASAIINTNWSIHDSHEYSFELKSEKFVRSIVEMRYK